MPHLQKARQIIQVVDPARTALEILRCLAALKAAANLAEIRFKVRPLCNFCGASLYFL